MIISIIGLAIGFAASFFILLYVLNEFNMDTCHKNRDQVYRVLIESKVFKKISSGTPPMLAQTFKDNIPEIEKISRLRSHNIQIKQNENWIGENVFAADNDIFDLFTFEFVEKSGIKGLIFLNT